MHDQSAREPSVGEPAHCNDDFPFSILHINLHINPIYRSVTQKNRADDTTGTFPLRPSTPDTPQKSQMIPNTRRSLPRVKEQTVKWGREAELMDFTNWGWERGAKNSLRNPGAHASREPFADHS